MLTIGASLNYKKNDRRYYEKVELDSINDIHVG